MRIDRDRNATGPVIRAMGADGFLIDGTRRRAALLTVERAIDWSPPPLADLSVEGLRPLLDPKPEFILLGTGVTLARPAPSLVAALEALDIGVDPMDSRAAARAWGVLRAEGRVVAAALYPIA